ncbi:MAG TPA: cupin domain-containing protein [Bryobacteraceae bacterium]|nr:cupin domain-containing protein [Bryobacteraceae bacterium]
MDLSRRDLNFLWSLLAVTGTAKESDAVLPSNCYSFANLPVKINPQTKAESRQVFKGTTHDGTPIDLHVTTMPPGQMPHPPHHHVHEEMMLIQRGSLEVTINGETSVVGPGSVIYVHSNDEHGLKCTGDVTAQYFVLAIGAQSTT